MKSLRLIKRGSALLKYLPLVVSATRAAGGSEPEAGDSTAGWRVPRLLSGSLICSAISLVAALLVSAASPAQAPYQDEEQTFADSYTPMVYSVEDTGARYTAPEFPAFSQLPIIRPLPDPFLRADGSRDTSFAGWEQRRNEIKAAIEQYEIGPKPDCSDCTITARWQPPAAGSTTGQGTLTVVVTRNGKSITLTSNIWLPSGVGSGPYPALIGVAYFPTASGPNYGFLPPSVFQNLPIATVDFVHNQVAEYTFTLSSHATDPFYQLYPELCAGICSSGTSNSGEFAAWAWGVSRLIDGMEIASHQASNPLPIDTKHLGITGCSYAGKIALFAGAFDERIALTIAQENGGGGAPSWRVSHEIEAQGTVEDIDDTDYDWFGGQMQQFAGANVYKMPVDQHELLAMVAPRGLLETGNTEFYWLSNGSNYIAARAAQKIYNTLGIGDRFGFYIDGNHDHCATLPAEAPAVQAFVDKFLLDKPANTDVQVYPNPADTADYGYPIVVGDGGYSYFFPTIHYQRWTKWWGSADPVFPDNWSAGGTVVASLNGALQINPADIIEGGYDLLLGGKHPAATVSLLPGANISADITCLDGSSYTLTIPLPAQTYSFPAGDGSPQPAPAPGGPAVYQGSATASAPAGAPPCARGRVDHAYFSATGVSENGDGNPGGPGFLTTDVTDPLLLRFRLLDQSTGQRSGYSSPVTIDWHPLTSANSTNQNPVAQ